MCTCASCKFTDSFRSKGFEAWPKGEPKGPARSKAEYAAHWQHCGGSQRPRTLGSPFPCTGTKQTDPRLWYHFPGGQVGKGRVHPGADLVPRSKPLPMSHTLEGYMEAFTKANNLKP